QAGKLIVYASTPISPRGGGHVATNLAVAASVKARIEKEYGAAVWGLDPGRYQMEAGERDQAGGAGEQGLWAARPPRGGGAREGPSTGPPPAAPATWVRCPAAGARTSRAASPAGSPSAQPPTPS